MADLRLIFETPRCHIPEDDIVMCFVIKYFGFWRSRYTMPISWGLDTACLHNNLSVRLCHSRKYSIISIESCTVCIDEHLSSLFDTVYWSHWKDTIAGLHGRQT